MDRSAGSERWWDSESPQAQIIQGVIGKDAWSHGAEFFKMESHRVGHQRLLRSTVNLYYMQTLAGSDDPTAQRLDGTLRGLVEGTFSQVDRTLGATPEPDRPAAQALLIDIIQVARPVVEAHEGQFSFGGIRALIDKVILGMVETAPEDEELATRLATTFVRGGEIKASRRGSRAAALAGHLSDRLTAPPYSVSSNLLSNALRRLHASYAVWLGGTTRVDDTDMLVLSLFGKQDGRHMSMRELMAASDDPQAAHRAVIARLEEFLTSPAPSRELLHRQGRLAREAVQQRVPALPEYGVIPAAELELIVDRLTLSQLVDGLITLGSIAQRESAALRAHILSMTEPVPTNQVLARGLRSVRGFVDEYQPSLDTETGRLAYSLMMQVVGTDIGEPVPLLAALRAEAAGRVGNVEDEGFRQEVWQLTGAFTHLFRRVFFNALTRRPLRAATTIKEIMRQDRIRRGQALPEDL